MVSITCSGQVFHDDVLSTSQTISDMMTDCEEETEILAPVPNEYLPALQQLGINFNLRNIKFIQKNKQKLARLVEDNFISADAFLRMVEKAESYSQVLIDRLLLYNFLNVQATYQNTLAQKIGQLYERTQKILDINPDINTLILENYPVLKLYEQYENMWVPPHLQEEIKLYPQKFITSTYSKSKAYDDWVKTIITPKYPKSNPYEKHEKKYQLLLAYIKARNLPMIKYLHKHGADINHIGFISEVAGTGDLEMIKYFHSQIPDIILKRDYTLSVISMRYGHFHVLRYLHEHGVNIIRDDIIVVASITDWSIYLDIAKFLVEELKICTKNHIKDILSPYTIREDLLLYLDS